MILTVRVRNTDECIVHNLLFGPLDKEVFLCPDPLWNIPISRRSLEFLAAYRGLRRHPTDVQAVRHSPLSAYCREIETALFFLQTES